MERLRIKPNRKGRLNNTMSSRSDTNYNLDTARSVEAFRPVRILSVHLKWLDSIIHWWKGNIKYIHTDPAVVAKCNSRILSQLENYRAVFYNKVRTFKQCLALAIELQGSHGGESNEFRNSERQVNKMQRELERTLDSYGHVVQALVTQWFHEDEYFTITDVEVKGAGYDFDIEVADRCDNKFDVEVWSGQSKIHHATRESAPIVGVYDGIIRSHPGTVPNRLSDVASNHGGVSLDSKHDLPKVEEKLAQLRDDHVGFLVACRLGGDRPATLWGNNFPIVPLDLIPPNKCIIVLDFDGGPAFGERGIGYVLHHPAFGQPRVARRIIRSLGFKYDQDRYARKVQMFNELNLA